MGYCIFAKIMITIFFIMSKFMSVYPKYYHDINFFIYIFFGIKSNLKKERKAKQEKLKSTIMKRRCSLGAEVSESL